MIPSFEHRHSLGGRALAMSDSESSTTQQTLQTDNRRVIGQGGVSAENSTIISNTTSYALDAQVANAAITTSKNDLVAALNHDQTITGRALDSVDSVAGRAFDFSAGTVDAVAQSSSRALAFSAGTLDTLASFFGKQQAAANANLDTEANLVKDAYADAKGRGAMTDKILIGAVVMAGLVALAAVRGAK